MPPYGGQEWQEAFRCWSSRRSSAAVSIVLQARQAEDLSSWCCSKLKMLMEIAHAIVLMQSLYWGGIWVAVWHRSNMKNKQTNQSKRKPQQQSKKHAVRLGSAMKFPKPGEVWPLPFCPTLLHLQALTDLQTNSSYKSSIHNSHNIMPGILILLFLSIFAVAPMRCLNKT